MAFFSHFNVMQDGLLDIVSNRQCINWLQNFWFSAHGSLSSNLIGQNGYLGGMRLLRDSGSQF